MMILTFFWCNRAILRVVLLDTKYRQSIQRKNESTLNESKYLYLLNVECRLVCDSHTVTYYFKESCVSFWFKLSFIKRFMKSHSAKLINLSFSFDFYTEILKLEDWRPRIDWSKIPTAEFIIYFHHNHQFLFWNCSMPTKNLPNWMDSKKMDTLQVCSTTSTQSLLGGSKPSSRAPSPCRSDQCK